MARIPILEESRKLPCIICDKVDGTMAHHVKTRGAGGNNEPYNLMKLCAKHHLAIHMSGLKAFADNYLAVKNFLFENGWTLDPYGKYRHY